MRAQLAKNGLSVQLSGTTAPIKKNFRYKNR